jgi:uncharacterized protein
MVCSRLTAFLRPTDARFVASTSHHSSLTRRAVITALFAFLLAILPALWQVAPVHADAELEQLTIKTGSASAPLNFTIEVARSPRQKALGLMYRRNLAAGRGMLFPYDEEQEVSMWMKNTYIPLDMLFIKANGEIHRVAAMTEPFSERIIKSEGPVKAVLEIAGGDAKRLGIAPGDTVHHPLFATGR